MAHLPLTKGSKLTNNNTSQSDRLKDEAHKDLDRLWAWADSEKLFGQIVIKAKFEDGLAIRLYLSPTEMKI